MAGIANGLRPWRARMLYEGVVSERDGDQFVLAPSSGAHRRAIDRAGNILSETRQPGARLNANIGDRLIVCGPTLEETTMVLVDQVVRDGYALRVRLVHGTLADSTTKVRILRVTSKLRGRA
jgi:hypothetical protein